MTITEIANELRTQDNRITSHPMFIVQKQIRDIGMGPDYTDEIAWIFDGDEITGSERDELEKSYQETGETGENIRTGMRTRWENVQTFFTNKSAQEFIGNANDELRIYVASGYKNPEWQFIRNYIMDNH